MNRIKGKTVEMERVKREKMKRRRVKILQGTITRMKARVRNPNMMIQKMKIGPQARIKPLRKRDHPSFMKSWTKFGQK